MFPKYNVLSKFLLGLTPKYLVCSEARNWLEENKYRGTKWLWNNCPHVDWMVYLLFLCKGRNGWITEKTWNKLYTKYVEEAYPAASFEHGKVPYFVMLNTCSLTPSVIRKLVPSPYVGKRAA